MASARSLLLGLALAGLAACQGISLDHTLVYLVNKSPDEVMVVDVDEGKVKRRFMAGEGLSDILLLPERGIGYVTNQHGGAIVIVDLARGTVCQRRAHARQQADRAQIDVLLELAPQRDQQAP